MKQRRLPKLKLIKHLKNPTEKELTIQILDYLKYIPHLTVKKIFAGIGMRGVLDLIGCWNGEYFELEIKTPRGKLSEWQKERIKLIESSGGITGVVYSVEDVAKIFDRKHRIELR